MMYSINITNNSNSVQNFIVFQASPEEDLMSLAWRSRSISPHSRNIFEITPKYSFVFGNADKLRPGEHFKASKTSQASLPDQSKVVFDGSNFTEIKKGSGEYFTITEEESVPENKLAVGLSLDDSPLFISQAKPNGELIIPKPHQKYYIATGQFREGDVIDARTLMTQGAIVDFHGGCQNVEVTYEANGSWTVRNIW